MALRVLLLRQRQKTLIYVFIYQNVIVTMLLLKPRKIYSDTKAKYLMINTNDKNKLSSSEILENDKIDDRHKFMLREPNVGDFNIITATNGGELYLRTSGNNDLMFEKSERTNAQFWRLEPVNKPITNGVYTIKNNSLEKYMTDVNGNLKLATNQMETTKSGM